MKTALLKDILREIRHSLPRFLSIMLMISLGVFVYSGLKGAAPLMRNTLNDFTEKTNMADLKIETVFGLERKDISIIMSDPEIKQAEFLHSVNLNTVDSDLLIQLQSLPKSLSIPYLTAGRQPLSVDEILLDDSLQAKGYRLGDRIYLKKESNKFSLQSDDESDTLKRYHFKIVGFCYHPEFVQPNLKNESDDGLGKIDAFAFVSEKNFNLTDYRFVRLKLRSTEKLLSENTAYRRITSRFKEELVLRLAERPKIRLRDLKKEAMDKIRENEDILRDARRRLRDAENQLISAEQKILDGEDKLEKEKNNLKTQMDKAEKNIHKAQLELDSAKVKLDVGFTAYEQKKSEYDSAENRYQTGYSALDETRKNLRQQQNQLLQSQSEIETGINQIDSALTKLYNSEKELLSALPLLGIPVDSFQLKVRTAVETDNFALLNTMGEIALNYATILRSRRELIAKKSELLKHKEEVLHGLDSIADGFVGLAEKEAELVRVRRELDQGKAALSAAKMELENGQSNYQNGLLKLQESKDTLASELEKARIEITKAENELSTARRKYKEGKKELEEKEAEADTKITDGQKKIDDAKRIIRALKEPAYKVKTRDDIDHYFIYFDSAKRMEFLSNIFPVFFFLIAMLVCLSTMTRMAEEHRSQIGTLKALGYGTWDIAKKYFYYGLFSSLLGGVIGISLGQPILSRVVYAAYNDTFIIQKPLFKMFWQYNITSVLIGIGCTAFVAFFVVNKHLRQNASSLMRPKAPKSGTKIALERIGFVWRRMSFLQKVTARNMFRYKARMMMAIMGISGCTALVFLGFSLRDSVAHLLPVQFEELTLYQYLAIYDEDLSDTAAKEFRDYLRDSVTIDSYSTLFLESMTWKKTGITDQKVQILIPQDPVGFSAMQTLRSPNNKRLPVLPDDGAIITNKLAKLAGIKAGDSIEVIREDGKHFRIPIAQISENYLGHYLYMSKDFYVRRFGKNPVWNAKALLLKSGYKKADTDTLVSELLDLDVVLSVTETNFASAAQSLESLDIVVGIMILLSSMLAFVVLYNLSNINISERMRELSTIKVLGFYPQELTAYVYRETFSLSLIGIGFGYIIGILLHKMILEVIVPDAFQLYPKIFPMTYVIAAIMTLLFSVIVMIFVHFRLKRIDMVEALKSYE